MDLDEKWHEINGFIALLCLLLEKMSSMLNEIESYTLRKDIKMIFKETANKQMPTIILLHGGGLSSWSLQSIVEHLQSEFHVVTPVIDGHGENGDEEFISIRDSAEKLINYY